MLHLPDIESTPLDRNLQPGVYKILNDANPDSSIDLSGHDMKRVIAYGSHNGENQKVFCVIGHLRNLDLTIISGKSSTWDLAIPLDLGSTVLTLCTMIATQYPVSWAIEPDDFEEGIYRIRWPDTPFVFDLPEGMGHIIQLSNRYPFTHQTLEICSDKSEHGPSLTKSTIEHHDRIRDHGTKTIGAKPADHNRRYGHRCRRPEVGWQWGRLPLRRLQ